MTQAADTLADPPAAAAEGPPLLARVLIVDDTLTVRLFCAQLLSREGFAVAEAINGLEALEQALAQAFDLFVVDINMARMDGYTFLAEVRRHPGLAPIPAVMLSTEQASEDIERAYRGRTSTSPSRSTPSASSPRSS